MGKYLSEDTVISAVMIVLGVDVIHIYSASFGCITIHWLKNSRHFFIQSKVKLNPIVTRSHTSPALFVSYISWEQKIRVSRVGGEKSTTAPPVLDICFCGNAGQCFQLLIIIQLEGTPR